MTFEGGTYQARFDALAAAGEDVHGEAAFVRSLGPSTVLDAGCGTGRVAIELARHGIDVVGADLIESMIATARARGPGIDFRVADVATLDLGRRFDIVLMAGNVPLFAELGTRSALVAGCARHIATEGRLVAGFQLGRGYGLAEYDADAAAAGLELVERFATWDREPLPDDPDYAVSVHRRGVAASDIGD